jgi:hypothetical protein
MSRKGKYMLKLIEKNTAKKAPDFSNLDTEGRNVTLSSYIRKSNVVLVLNRGFG